MGLEKLGVILKRFEKFGLPLHFTENTLVSGHIMPPDIVDLNDYQIPEWHTAPVLTTGSQGRAKMTGFRGDYKASLEGNASTFKLTKESGEISITL